jgi:hypothetical protein
VGTNRRGKGIRKGKRRANMVVHFVFVYENRRMKPVEIVLRNGGGEMRENNG